MLRIGNKYNVVGCQSTSTCLSCLEMLSSQLAEYVSSMAITPIVSKWLKTEYAWAGRKHFTRADGPHDWPNEPT